MFDKPNQLIFYVNVLLAVFGVWSLRPVTLCGLIFAQRVVVVYEQIRQTNLHLPSPI